MPIIDTKHAGNRIEKRPLSRRETATYPVNLPVGVAADLTFSEQETVLAPDMTLFLYTDGLTEAENGVHELFGKQRIDEVLATFEGSPQELIEAMTAAVHQFVGDTEQSDDLTMLAFRIRK
jgi:sigma-B regulation protein RsbU (phosphoserine phosphatase)